MRDTIRLATSATEASAGRGSVGHRWRLRPTVPYLRALREADHAVVRVLLRRLVLRHSERVLRG